MSAISIRCTGCGTRLKAPEGKAKVRCPCCGTVIRVPRPDEAEEAARCVARLARLQQSLANLSPASFEEFLGELSSLSAPAGAGTPAIDPTLVREAAAAAEALAGLGTITRETIAETVQSHPQ